MHRSNVTTYEDEEIPDEMISDQFVIKNTKLVTQK